MPLGLAPATWVFFPSLLASGPMKHATSGLILAIAAAALQGSALTAAGPDYNRDVRPILSNRCFKCHGPDEENQEAGGNSTAASGRSCRATPTRANSSPGSRATTPTS